MLAGLLAALCSLLGCTPRAAVLHEVLREQHSIEVRDPAQILPVPAPEVPEPETVSHPPPDVNPEVLTLDAAIRIALANSEVVRVLAGTTAVSSGRTIYDPAISNTDIDAARSVFDPVLNFNSNFNRIDQPFAFIDPGAPLGARIAGSTTDRDDVNLGISKRTVTGGTARLDFGNTHNEFASPSALNPEDRSSLTLSYTQPFFLGGGIPVNVSPIVIARINTERSFFQQKDAVQELVRGVIEAYWAVVFAHVDVWAREQQVKLGDFNYRRALAREGPLGTLGESAQARVALLGFQNALIASRANLISREAALRNILGYPPTNPERIEVTTRPTDSRLRPKWEELLRLAAERRPDIIELKLILEADQQVVLQARNQARPRLDASLLYRWNGLEGRTPTRRFISSESGQFADWTVGVNFSVPLGLRQGRAALRNAQLRMSRDRANLDQGYHQLVHDLAATVRLLDQLYEQYEVLKRTREAATINLQQQNRDFKARGLDQLNVLQAINDFGNAISAEAQALTQYNVALATLERQTGTILESHGVRLFEERFRSIGPLGILGDCEEYPASVIPGENAPRYPAGDGPAENFFDLQAIPDLESDPKGDAKLPPPRELPNMGERPGGLPNPGSPR